MTLLFVVFSLLLFSIVILVIFSSTTFYIKTLAQPDGVDENPYDDENDEKGTSNKSYPDFNFVVAGDFGCSNRAKNTVNNMISKNPELVIALGDLSYRKSTNCWFDLIAPLDTKGKLKIAFGEHDIDTKIDENLTRYNEYLRHFNLTKPYYSFDYQNVHFLGMTTAKNKAVPYNASSDQYEFVKKDLEQAIRTRILT